MQKASVGRPRSIPEKVFLKMSELSQGENHCPPYHKIHAQHNYWHRRHPGNKYACPYCNLGSEPIHDTLVDEMNGHGDNVVVKKVEEVIV